MGGRGTRLQPLTDTRPKPMLPIVDVPFLAHQLAQLRRHGVVDVTFACGFLPRAIMAHFGDGNEIGMRLQYVVEPEPLGTGGAIGFAARSTGDSRVLVCNGDVLTELDVTALLRQHISSGATATIALTPVDDPSRYGLVRTNHDGAVLAFVEKPPADQVDTNMVNAGTYVLEPAAIALIPDGAACSIEREIFPQLVGDGLFAAGSDAYWKDIGTIASYLDANADMLRGRVTGASEQVAGGPRVHEDARVSNDAVLHAPCYVGADAQVLDGATIGPDAVVGDGALVAHGARVVRAVVLEHATVEREAQVVRSIVGEHATVSQRTTVSDGAVVAPKGRAEGGLVRGELR